MSATNLGDVRGPHPDDLALIDARDWEVPRQRTHGELDREATAVAAALSRCGLAAGATVAVLATNRSEYVTTFLGILRAGMIAVPVNAKFPAATVAHVLADANVQLTFCDAAGGELLAATARAVRFDEAGPGGFAHFAGAETSCEPSVVAPSDVAMILYTSGSTGLPKGVPLSHGAHRWILDNRVAAARGTPAGRVLIVAPLSHMNALGMSLFVVASGSSAALLPAFEVRRFIAAAERFSCEVLSTVPAMMALVLREREALAAADLHRVRTIRMGSAPIPDQLWDDVQRAFPQATIRNGYGTTEAGPGVFGALPDRSVPRGACGWPQPGFEVRIVGDDGRPAAEGVLWMRSPANATGYLHLPEQTRRAFTPDGWYISGDRFRRDDDGVYWFVGRDDDMFVCGGENVYPTEVERVIERHPDVLESCVVPVPDDVKGQKPVAFVVRRPGGMIGEDGLRQFVLANAPAYQHPRMVTFVDALPTSGPGKIDRKRLVEQARDLWAERLTKVT